MAVSMGKLRVDLTVQRMGHRMVQRMGHEMVQKMAQRMGTLMGM